MNLKELDVIYEVLSQLRAGLTFKEFDDLVYEKKPCFYKKFIEHLSSQKLSFLILFSTTFFIFFSTSTRTAFISLYLRLV